MVGKVVKQLNNLKITCDEKARLYRVYTLDGVELYHSPIFSDVLTRCAQCTTYTQHSPHYYYEVRVRYTPQGSPDDYTVYIKTKEHLRYEVDVIEYAVRNDLFDYADDAKCVAYVNEISASEYAIVKAS